MSKNVRSSYERNDRVPSTSYYRQYFITGRKTQSKMKSGVGGLNDVNMRMRNASEDDHRKQPESFMKDSHQMSKAKKEENRKMREALGIRHSFLKGSSLNPALKKREAAVAAAAAEIAKKKYINSCNQEKSNSRNFERDSGKSKDDRFQPDRDFHRWHNHMTSLSSIAGSPQATSFDSKIRPLLQTYVRENYNPMTRSLSISNHFNKFLKSQRLYIPLNRSLVFKTVLKIITEHIPEIEDLDMSNNNLNQLEPVCKLVNNCKHLKYVNLKNNVLQNVMELDYLRGLHLDQLILDGNPLCDDFKEKAAYARLIQKHLPTLTRLDGRKLSNDFTGWCDFSTETLPASKKNFFSTDELKDSDMKDLVTEFLDLYYTIYDSEDRMKLLDPYHEEASFSLCLPNKEYQHTTSEGSLGAYCAHNRNLSVIAPAIRCERLKKGRLAVVTALQDLPRTSHDPTSFSVDIFHVSPGLMSFSVVGVFEEADADISHAVLKTFCRTFVVVPQSSGFVIVNETLFIAHASKEQQSEAFKVPALILPPGTAAPTDGPPTDERRPIEFELVTELSAQTQMNTKFSIKCLEENDWDFQRALDAFKKLLKECKVPAEAFM